MSSSSGWSELWLTAGAVLLPPVVGWNPLSDLGWKGGGLCLLLMWMCLWASLVPVQALFLCWLSGALSGEQLHFLSLRSMPSVRDGSLTGVPEVRMSEMARTGGGRVLAQSTGLLVNAGHERPWIQKLCHLPGLPPLVAWQWWVLYPWSMWELH